jgi:hypothetical protein
VPPGATPPSLIGVFDAIHCSTEVTPLALVKAHTASSPIGAPMSSNFLASNSIPGWPSACPRKSAPLKCPIVRPSGFATR